MSFEQPATSLARRLIWFAVLWLAGVGSVALVAFILRLWLK